MGWRDEVEDKRQNPRTEMPQSFRSVQSQRKNKNNKIERSAALVKGRGGWKL